MLSGEVAVFYLFARFRFNWNEVDYSAFSTYCVIVNLIGEPLTPARLRRRSLDLTCLSAGMAVITVVMSRALRWDDWLIGALSCTSKLCGSLCFAFCDSVPLFYAGEFPRTTPPGGDLPQSTRIFVRQPQPSTCSPAEATSSSGLPPPSWSPSRNSVSRVASTPSVECDRRRGSSASLCLAGKMNSLFGLCEAVAPLVYGPLYSWIYSATLDSMPGACFLVGFGLTLPAVVLFL